MSDHLTSHYRFKTPLWRWSGGNASWYFITLPIDVSEQIRSVDVAGLRRGFGSVKVIARIGASRWSTSLFPSKQHGSYLLPVKATVRKSEALEEGGDVQVMLEVRRSG